MEGNVTAQELYNQFYFEACNRARTKGEDLPNEVEVFKILVKKSRQAIMDGDCPPDFLHELAEVKPHIAIEREASSRMDERDRALRNGTVIDMEDLLK